MLNLQKKHFQENHIIIYAAAVADYKPETYTSGKIKKTENALSIKLKPTKDIAGELSKLKRPDQITVGFALETDDETENAILKIQKKNFDFIVLNSLRDEGAGFAFDTNKISIIDKDNNIERFELKSKKDVSAYILNKILELLPTKK